MVWDHLLYHHQPSLSQWQGPLLPVSHIHKPTGFTELFWLCSLLYFTHKLIKSVAKRNLTILRATEQFTYTISTVHIYTGKMIISVHNNVTSGHSRFKTGSGMWITVFKSALAKNKPPGWGQMHATVQVLVMLGVQNGTPESQYGQHLHVNSGVSTAKQQNPLTSLSKSMFRCWAINNSFRVAAAGQITLDEFVRETQRSLLRLQNLLLDVNPSGWLQRRVTGNS